MHAITCLFHDEVTTEVHVSHHINPTLVVHTHFPTARHVVVVVASTAFWGRAFHEGWTEEIGGARGGGGGRDGEAMQKGRAPPLPKLTCRYVHPHAFQVSLCSHAQTCNFYSGMLGICLPQNKSRIIPGCEIHPQYALRRGKKRPPNTACSKENCGLHGTPSTTRPQLSNKPAQ